MKIRIRIEKKFITSEMNNLQTSLLQNFLYIVLLWTFWFYFPRHSVINWSYLLYSFFPTFCNEWILSLTILDFQVLGLLSSFGFVSIIPHTHTHTTVLNAHPTIFYFRVLGFLSIFSFLWINPTRYTNCKKKLCFLIPILIYNFWSQMVPLKSSSFVHCEYCIFK